MPNNSPAGRLGAVVELPSYLYAYLSASQDTYSHGYVVPVPAHVARSAIEVGLHAIHVEQPALSLSLSTQPAGASPEVERVAPVARLADIRLASGDDVEQVYTDWVYRPFDPGVEPLARYALIHGSDGQRWFAASFHHLVMDGTSIWLHGHHLVRRFFENRLIPTRSIPFPEWWAAVQQRDVDNRAAWRAHLGGSAESYVRIPKKTPMSEPTASPFIERHLDVTHLSQIRRFCRQHGITVPLYFMGLYGLVVNALYAVGASFVVRDVQANRDRATADMMGCFISNALYGFGCSDFTGTVVAYLQTLRDKRKNAGRCGPLHAWQVGDVVSENLVLSYNYIHFLEHMTSGEGEHDNYGLSSRHHNVVQLIVKNAGSHARLSLVHSAQVDMDSRFLERMLAVSDQLVGQSVVQVQDLAILLGGEDGAERRGEALSAYPDLNTQLLSCWRENASRPALWIEGEEYSYTAFYRRVFGIMARYEEAHLRASPVLILMNKSLDAYAAFIAALLSGNVAVPVNRDIPLERLQYILDDTRAAALVTDHDGDRYLSQEAVRTPIRLVLGGEQRECDIAPGQCRYDGGPAYVIYTSGSSGQPKGVRVSADALAQRAQAWQRCYGLNASDRILQLAEMGFDVFVGDLLRALTSGAALVVPTRGDIATPAHLATLIQNQRLTCAEFTPTTLAPLVTYLESEGKRLNLRVLVIGSENLPWPLVEAVQRICSGRLFNSYGTTESTIDNTFYGLPDSSSVMSQQQSNVPAGQPLAGVQVSVRNQQGHLLPVGVPGELYIGGGLADGYVGAAQDQNNRFVIVGTERHYRTGDLAIMDHGGVLSILGRLDGQLKINGIRLDPLEMQSALMASGAVRDAHVCQVERFGKAQLVAFVVPKKDMSTRLLKAWILQELARRFARALLPSRIVVLDQFPRNANGKVDARGMIAEHLQASSPPTERPLSDTEAAVADVYAAELGVYITDPSARFFDLGGHSLAAMRVVAALQRQGLSGVSASEMLENPSVSELARLINARRGDGQHVAALVSSPRMARYRCSREQERMWFLYRMNPASNAYSMPAAFHIRGEFDTEAFKASVNEVCRLHAQLHVRFFEDEGEVWQERDERRGPEYIELDFTHHRKAESDAYLKSEIARPFRLESEPLVRVYVLRTGRESALLMFNIHHIVSDGWSSNVFSQDVLLAYCQRSMGTRIALSKPEFEYFDYVAYQRSQQQCAALRRDLIYWKQKLAGLPERTPLRLTRAPLLESHHQICVRKRFEVPASLYASIKEFCRLRDVTEFVFLLAAYKAVLYRYTGQPDVCVGVPVARRDVMGTQNLVGFFVDAAVLRTQVDPRQSYSVLLDEVKATCQQASAHNTAQIADILEVLRLERARDERELLSAGFSFLKTAYAIEGELVPGVQIEEYGAAAQDAKFDLTLSMSSTEDDSETETMKAAIECRSRVGDLASLDWFWQAYVSELGALLADAPALQKVESHPQQAWVDLPCSDGVEALYPLNSTQLSMVMGAQLNPNSLDYSHGYKMLVDVDVDEQRWAAAIRRVTEQNPALRTRFAACRSPLSDEYVGIVMSAQDCAVHLQVERTHERPGAAVVDAQVADFIYQPYDVLSSHVVRHKLIKYATGGSLILFACHHALVDGLSLHRILTQVLDCYREGDAARPAAKPLVSSTARKPALCPDSSLAFWRDQGGRFASLDNVLLQAEQQPERRTIKQVYARDQRAQQRRICRSLGVSHAFYWQVVTMLATRQYYRGGDRQPIINIVSGRNKENASDVGCYIEKQYFFLPVEWLTSSINLATLFEKAKRQYRDIKGHYGISWAEFSRVMSERASDLSFNYQHFLDPIDLYGKQYHLSGCPCWSEKVIQVIARDHQDFFEIACLSGSNQKFDERILDRMVSINAQICESVERSVDQLVPWLPDEQRSVVVGKSLPQTMDRHHVFESWVQNNARLAPDQDALVDAHHRLTWREVEHLSASLALRIQVCVSSKLGATVAVAMEKSVLLYVALIAVQRSGCAYVPLDPGYPEERLTYMMEDSGARLLLTDKAKMSAMASEHAVQCIELETVQSMVSAALLPDGRLQLSDGKKGADRLAYIIYTSGTTGKPKGVCMGEAALAEKGIAWQQAYRLASSDVHLQMSNSAFDVCTGDVVRWLVSGSCLVACTYDELIDPAQLCQKMQDEGVTIAEFVPAVLRSVMDYLEEGNQRFPALRWIIVGSDKWYESDQERLNRLLPELTQCINSYGVTEVSIDSTYRKLLTSVSSDQATSSDGVMPIGQPFPGTTACVVDTAMQVLPRGFTGELCLAGGGGTGVSPPGCRDCPRIFLE
ncbi:MAG: AMP-binding protein [Ketobacter sp.]|nr:AMP-binding protein [Ketobacter sp.]